VADEHHDALVVVITGAIMRNAGVGIVATFPGDALVAPQATLMAGICGFSFKIVDAVENFVAQRHFRRFAVSGTRVSSA
jgi:hypothetical protein